MNCEDIAMNFLISNITRKAPIKVSLFKIIKYFLYCFILVTSQNVTKEFGCIYKNKI